LDENLFPGWSFALDEVPTRLTACTVRQCRKP
jgi:hypothetical protein